MNPPRLDLLIYAHDGRGLGHASRSIAIGMAFRRLFPEKSVLFLSGSRLSSSLIGSVPLDWVKLPAYATSVNNGVSKGAVGPANFNDAHLGSLRADTIDHIVRRYLPRCVLADHSPQGKHQELVPAQKSAVGKGIQWVLGVRGVVGSVRQVQSPLSAQLFRDHYHMLFWYGDTKVLGREDQKALEEHFGKKPVETGYVSRLSELYHWGAVNTLRDDKWAGTISIPWMGEHTMSLCEHIAGAIGNIGDTFGKWRIFIGFDHDALRTEKVYSFFDDLPFCQVLPAGEAYAESLINSKIALIFGGYNSLMDVMWSGKPAVVILRGMEDREQERHLEMINRSRCYELSVIDETSATSDVIESALRKQLDCEVNEEMPVRLDGAQTAARLLADIIDNCQQIEP